MGLGFSIFLIAAGAICTFALEREVSGVDINTVGVILMVVGAIGLVISLFMLDSFRNRRGGVVEERRYVRDDVPPDRPLR